MKTRHCILVQGLKGFLRGYCADLSTSMKFGTDVDQNILNSRPAKAHYCNMLGIFCYKLVTMPVQLTHMWTFGLRWIRLHLMSYMVQNGVIWCKNLKKSLFQYFFHLSIHNTIKQASNYGSSIEAYVYFSIMLDAMEPGAPYGVK